MRLLEYTAPELRTSSGVYNAKSDCYGVGRIFRDTFHAIDPSDADELEETYDLSEFDESLEPVTSGDLMDRYEAPRSPMARFNDM